MKKITSVVKSINGIIPHEPEEEARARYVFVNQLGEDVEFQSWFSENDVVKACRLDWNWELLQEDLPKHCIPIGCFATGEILLARFRESGGLRNIVFWDLLGKDRKFEGDEIYTIARDTFEFSRKLKFDARYGRGADVRKANEMLGRVRTLKGYTWHYHKGTERMQLVPSDVHRATYFS